jgi:phenylacetate-CoA ligase
MANNRYPTLTKAGQAMLNKMLEHPAAPIYRNESGNCLKKDDLLKVIEFDNYVKSESVSWPRDDIPYWVDAFVKKTFLDVPHYKKFDPQLNFTDIPTTSRSELAQDISQFFPDSIPIERLVNYKTTGTTGNRLIIASHPIVAANYLCFHRKALKRFGINLTNGKGQIGIVLVGHQKKCFTYVSVTPMLDESGLAKINLHPIDWRQPEDRAVYLDALCTELYSGDPLSFSELLNIETTHKPKALISVGMKLLPGLKDKLQKKFACPVLDIYSMNEAGPIAVFDELINGHVLLQPNLYVEILNAAGKPVKHGERGEITLTGGFNFCLPLVRYRTGDFASLSFTPEGPVLFGLEGRPPVRFFTAKKLWINNIDISHALSQFALSQFGLHQNKDGSFVLKLSPSAMSQSNEIIPCLKTELGNAPISVAEITTEDKIIQYTSDFPGHNCL